jgi:hypothetical protein
MNWHLSSGGEFSIKSAYGLQQSSLDSHRDKDPLWRLIWHWKGIERVKVFLWTVAHEAIIKLLYMAD